MNYKKIKMKYDMRRITATQVWEYADEGIITEEEAAKICGARPRNDE